MEIKTCGESCLGFSRGHKASINNSSPLPRCSQHSNIELLSLSLWVLVYLEGDPTGQRNAVANLASTLNPLNICRMCLAQGQLRLSSPKGSQRMSEQAQRWGKSQRWRELISHLWHLSSTALPVGHWLCDFLHTRKKNKNPWRRMWWNSRIWKAHL